MAEDKKSQSENEAHKDEQYTHGYNTQVIDHLQARTVKEQAAFFKPHLHSGMSLLDCGCGPGTITSGLAQIVSPGHVKGIDIDEGQINLAIDYANKQGISDVSFELANLYEMPFEDNSFDAAFGHTILQHLNDPLAGLKEIHRVLKPGGVLGLRDDDHGAFIRVPWNSVCDQGYELFKNTWKLQGGDPLFGRRHREMLRKAGFINTIAAASCEHYGTPEATKSFGETAAGFIESFAKTATQLGWTDRNMIEQIKQEWLDWGKNPDAFYMLPYCESVGWKP